MADPLQEKADSKGVDIAESGDTIRDKRDYVIHQSKQRLGLTAKALSDNDGNDMGRTVERRIDYLEGVRGLLGLETLIWIFFRMFAPAIVTDVDIDGIRPALFVQQSPEWMSILRKVLSPLLFDGSLQMAGFIVLMGRVSVQTFVERREPTTLAGQCVRRPVRLLIPVALSLMMASVLSATSGFKNSAWLADRLRNQTLIAPPPLESAIVYFNSLVAFFFSPITYTTSRAVMSIPPYGVMWFVSAVGYFPWMH